MKISSEKEREQDRDLKQQYITLALLMITFESISVLLAFRGNLTVLQEPWMLLLVGLAAFRGGRAIAFNYMFKWLRAPFTEEVDDSSGAGKSVVAKGKGLKRVVGELLCCPICAGSWVALVVTGLVVLIYPVGLMVGFILAASGIAEVVHWFSEREEWEGRKAREESGTAWLLKNRGTIYPESGLHIPSISDEEQDRQFVTFFEESKKR